MELELLERMVLKAGVHQAIVKPAFAMYRACRAVKIGDAVAQGREPEFGLPAGCPFATFFMAVVTQPWRRQLRSSPSQPKVRTWVDDCTAYVRGTVAAIGLAGAAGRTAEDMEQSGTRVNVTKSGAVGSDEVHTAMMLLAAGPKFGCKEALKDLGVVQGAGCSQAEAAMLR